MSCRVWVGNLPSDIRESELDDLFYKYGKIRSIEIKAVRRPPYFAFVEFYDPRDADDAIRGRDGYSFDGARLRCEIAQDPRYGGLGEGRRGSRSRREDGGRGGGPSRRTGYRVIVENLPDSASWQDLKDHMRREGQVTYSDVFRDSKGSYGLVDYAHFDDMEYAIRRLDGSEFQNHRDSAKISVREYREGGGGGSGGGSGGGGGGGGQYRSPSRSRSRSPRHSPPRRVDSRSRSRSRSRSPAERDHRSRSRSPGRPYSRSPSPRRNDDSPRRD